MKFSEILTKLNSWDARRIDEPDYIVRLEAFDVAKETMTSSKEPSVDLLLMLLHNCCYFITNVCSSKR